MAEGHDINASLTWRQSPRQDALVLQNSSASSTFSFPTDGHTWRWHRPVWFVGRYLVAKTSEPSLTRTEFDLLSFSLQGKPSLMRDFSSYRNSYKEHKIPLPCTCTVYFLFTFFFLLHKIFDLFTLKNHQATDNKKSKPSGVLPPQGEIKTMKLPSSGKTFICQQLGKSFEWWKHDHLLMSFQNDLFPLSFNI